METLVTVIAIVVVCGVCLLLASLLRDPDEAEGEQSGSEGRSNCHS